MCARSVAVRRAVPARGIAIAERDEGVVPLLQLVEQIVEMIWRAARAAVEGLGGFRTHARERAAARLAGAARQFVQRFLDLLLGDLFRIGRTLARAGNGDS